MAVKSSFKNMTICLFAICLVCSALLAGVFVLTETPISEAKARKEASAIEEVLPSNIAKVGPQEVINVEGVDYKYNLAFDEKGTTIGCAINVSTSEAFSGVMEIKVGLQTDPSNPSSPIICNTKVLSHSETPGLGAKCIEPSFAGQFKGFDPKTKKLSVKKDGGDVDAITASTITSRAYVNCLNKALQVYAAILGIPMPIDVTSGASEPWEGNPEAENLEVENPETESPEAESPETESPEAENKTEE